MLYHALGSYCGSVVYIVMPLEKNSTNLIRQISRSVPTLDARYVNPVSIIKSLSVYDFVFVALQDQMPLDDGKFMSVLALSRVLVYNRQCLVSLSMSLGG